VSLVEVFVTGIRIVNQPNLSLIDSLIVPIWWSWFTRAQRAKIWKVNKIVSCVKNLLFSKHTIANVVWCKM